MPSRIRLSFLLLSFMLVLVSWACGGGGGSSAAPSGTPPSNLSYARAALTATVGEAILPDAPTLTGTATSFSIVPGLPSGLSLAVTSGVISGTPSAASASASYTITASNAYGSTTCTIQITVAPAAPVAPSQLTYKRPEVNGTVGQSLPPNVPSYTGTATSFSISPSLPAGLSLDSTTGILSGVPLVAAAQATYSVTAGNAVGTTTCQLKITVDPVATAAPSGFSYVTPELVGMVGVAIAPDLPSITGTVVSYSVAPALPVGLSLDPYLGTITGTPESVSAQATFTVTATNAVGAATTLLKITIKPAGILPPSSLSYAVPSLVATVGLAITPDVPTVTGTVTAYSIAPALPAGLAFNTATGVLSGTPTAVSPQTAYTVTASNGGGDATATLQIIVNPVPVAPPSGFSYAAMAINAFVGQPIEADVPAVTGTVSAYSVLPSLPAGLNLNAITGVITGTPTAVAAQASYTISATNSIGSATATVIITVSVAAPTNLVYPSTDIQAIVGSLIPTDTPTLTGSATSFTVSPALPAGLSLSTANGAISGTPSAVAARAVYTVTAMNASGSTTATIQIVVRTPAPTNLAYPIPSLTAVLGSPITTDTPTVVGQVTSFTISPDLPSGILFSSTTGAVSGIPTAVLARTRFTVTATNGTGSTTAALSLEVKIPAPANLSYPVATLVSTVGSAITPAVPTLTGTATSFTIAPSLPAGLALDSTTGILSGIPTVASPLASYTITATNTSGSTTTTLQISVQAVPVAPSSLTYPVTTLIALADATLTPIKPTVIGTVTTFSISPALPAGFAFSASDGTLSGKPTAQSPETTYTATASNSAGSTTATLKITVTASLVPPSNLVYPVTNIVAVLGTPLASNVPTVVGTATTFAINPSLPAGLAFSTTKGTISGTPAVLSAQASYTVTASNSVGSCSATVTLSVTGSGLLALGISGLPTGMAADVVVTGPGSFNRNVTATTSLAGLEAGVYTVTAHSVAMGTPVMTYFPWQPVQTVVVGSGATSCSVLYPLPTVTVPIPDLTNPGSTVPLTFRLVPAGSYMMGSLDPLDNWMNGVTTPAQPNHSVNFATGFYIGFYPVTQAQWKAVMASNPSRFSLAGGGSTTDNYTRPVERVSWDDIRVTTASPAYTCFLDRLNASVPGYQFSLPTEAQYEYALRGGTVTAYFHGLDSTSLGSYAWNFQNSPTSTQPVGGLKANPWGLYDLTGNVWEWCEDDWFGSYTGAPADGKAWLNTPRSDNRVLRGGSWLFIPVDAVFRSGYRYFHDSGARQNDFGFRLVIPVPINH